MPFIILLLALAVIPAVISINLSRENRELQESVDYKFSYSYDMLISNARNGYTPESADEYSFNSSVHGHTVANLFGLTSYSENAALRDLIHLLNDFIGEHRMYAGVTFADMPAQTVEMLVGLSSDFADTAAAALKALLHNNPG